MSIFKVKFERPTPTTNLKVNIPSRFSLNIATEGKKIWTVGGGKGGIGKTLITSNLAVFLSWMNKKVVVVDMDLGGANLHTSLGVVPSKKTLSDFVLGELEDINELVIPTKIQNLSLISGAQDPLGISNLRYIQKARLLRKFKELEADFIILDLGAGTSMSTVDFFLLGDNKIIVTTPEPTSIENAYRFIKTAFYRTLRNSSQNPTVKRLIETSIETKSETQLLNPMDLIVEVFKIAPEEGEFLKKQIQSFELYLILNQVRTKNEGDIGKSIQIVCEKYFGIKVVPLGFMSYDNSVWQAIRKKVPFLIDAPNSQVVTQLEEILRNLIKKDSVIKP